MKSKWEQRKSKSELMGSKEFINEYKNWGLKVACQNWLFCFTKWFIGAKRLKAIYK